MIVLILSFLIYCYSFAQKEQVNGKISVCAGICQYKIDPKLLKGCPSEVFQKSQIEYANYVAGLFITLITELNAKSDDNVTFFKNDPLKIDTLPFEIPSYKIIKVLSKTDDSYDYIFGGDKNPVCKVTPFLWEKKPKKCMKPVDSKQENFDNKYDYTLILWTNLAYVLYTKDPSPMSGNLGYGASIIYALYTKEGKLVFVDEVGAGSGIGYYDNDLTNAFENMSLGISSKLVEEIIDKLK